MINPRRMIYISCAYFLLVFVFMYQVYRHRDKFCTISPPNNDKLHLSNSEIAYELPQDYTVASKDEEWCERMYGTEYLMDFAQNHLPYCTEQSPSSLECFHSEIAAEETRTDHFCIAKGVRFNAQATTSPKKYGLDCQLRDWDAERAALKDPHSQELKDIVSIEKTKSYFFDTGVMEELKAYWEIGMEKNEDAIQCNKDNNDNTYYLLMKLESGNNLWHKILELWQAMMTLDMLQIAQNTSSPAKNLLLSPQDRPNVQVVLHDNDNIGPWEQYFTILTGNSPIRESQLSSNCLGNVILPLPGSSSPFWVYHWEPKNCFGSRLLDTFLRRFYLHLGIDPSQEARLQDKITVTIIDRRGRRKITGLPDMVEELKIRNPQVNIQLVDFATLTIKEQVELALKTDVLVGTIGAGLTHILYMHPAATVLEIFPTNFNYFGFRNLAKMRGMGYFSQHGISQEEWEKLSKKSASRSPHEKRWDWQTNDLYMDPQAFFASVEAAIQSQKHRGLTHEDVFVDPASSQH